MTASVRRDRCGSGHAPRPDLPDRGAGHDRFRAARPLRSRGPKGASVRQKFTGAKALMTAGALVVMAGCSSGGGSSPHNNSGGAGQPVRGGDLVIARTADSQSMNATTVFD